MTKDERRLGIGVMLGAVGLFVFAYLVSGRVGWFAWVLVAIAAVNLARGIFWFFKRRS